MIRFDSCGSSPLHIMAFSLQTPFLCVYLHTPLLMMTSEAVIRMVTWVNVLTSGRYWGSVGQRIYVCQEDIYWTPCTMLAGHHPPGAPRYHRQPGDPGAATTLHSSSSVLTSILWWIDIVQSPKLSRPLKLYIRWRQLVKMFKCQIVLWKHFLQGEGFKYWSM